MTTPAQAAYLIRNHWDHQHTPHPGCPCCIAWPPADAAETLAAWQKAGRPPLPVRPYVTVTDLERWLVADYSLGAAVAHWPAWWRECRRLLGLGGKGDEPMAE